MMGVLAAFEPAALESDAIEFTPVVAAVAALGWWSWFALLAKRLRDIGLGWGWALLALVPGFQLLALAAFAFPKSREGGWGVADRRRPHLSPAGRGEGQAGPAPTPRPRAGS